MGYAHLDEPWISKYTKQHSQKQDRIIQNFAEETANNKPYFKKI